MNNLQDLHFRKEIIPLFDFVCNETSRDTLIDLMTDIPPALEEVMERQDILRAFLLQSDPLLLPFSYIRYEFNEVAAYIQDWRVRPIPDLSSLRLQYMLKRKLRDRERGSLTLLYLFLHKTCNAWFTRITPDAFPQAFADILKNILQFIKDLEVEKYQAIARGRGFTIPEIILLLDKLAEKTRNGEMDIFWKNFHQFEAWLSIARGVHRHQFTFPVFSTTRFEITGFYHPLLKNPVKNSITIRENVTLITGPNMSGKSTLLKSLGLTVLLARLGLAVPAAACQLPFFDSISVAIDLHDDLKSGYSHFMKEVVTLKNIVLAAGEGKKCFAIFDELFRGTNPEDALAITETTIRGLTRWPDSYFFISTHLHQLRDSLDEHTHPIGTRYIACRLEKGHPVFSYTLQEGWSDLKIGQVIFELEGLNKLLQA